MVALRQQQKSTGVPRQALPIQPSKKIRHVASYDTSSSPMRRRTNATNICRRARPGVGLFGSRPTHLPPSKTTSTMCAAGGRPALSSSTSNAPIRTSDRAPTLYRGCVLIVVAVCTVLLSCMPRYPPSFDSFCRFPLSLSIYSVISTLGNIASPPPGCRMCRGLA